MTEETTTRRLGSWRPEMPDWRDKIFRPTAAVMKNEVAPMTTASRMHDQGMEGSCTGHGSTDLIEYELKLTGDAGQLSRNMAYYTGREAIDEVQFDNGAYIRDVIKGITKVGVCRETLHPYSTKTLAKKPSAAAYKQALEIRDRIAAQGLIYERVNGLPELLGALNDGHPVVFGFVCFDSIFRLNKTDHVMPLPGPTDKPAGGHCVLACGFRMRDRVVWVKNSWGRSWGNNGYFLMPFSWFDDPRMLTDDMWTVRSTITPPPAP